MEGNDDFDFDQIININSQKQKEAHFGEGNSSSHQIEKKIFENREEYVKLNETSNLEDIKDQIFNICQSKIILFLKSALQLGEYKCTDDFNLEDTMNSVEVNHFKMDPHCNYREANTYLKLIKGGKIKKIEDLNIKEVFLNFY